MGLTLTRKPHERIVIENPNDPDDPIIIEVKAIRRNQVRLSITADRNLAIWRGEIVDNYTPGRALASSAASLKHWVCGCNVTRTNQTHCHTCKTRRP